MDIKISYKINADRDRLTYTPLEDCTFEHVMRLYKEHCSHLHTEAFLYGVLRAVKAAEEVGDVRLYMDTFKVDDMFCQVYLEVTPNQKEVEMYRTFPDRHMKLLRAAMLDKARHERKP